MVRVQTIDHLGQVLFYEIPRICASEEVGSFLLDRQMSESVQGGYPAQHIGRILEAIRVHLESPAIGQNRTAEPHARSSADLGETGIASIHEIVTEHQPEMPRMVNGKGKERETHRSHVSDDVL